MALYSRKDRTRAKYAVSLSFCGQPLRFRLKNDNLEFALPVMIEMCLDHSKLSLSVIHKSEGGLLPGCSHNVREILLFQEQIQLDIFLESLPTILTL